MEKNKNHTCLQREREREKERDRNRGKYQRMILIFFLSELSYLVVFESLILEIFRGKKEFERWKRS